MSKHTTKASEELRKQLHHRDFSNDPGGAYSTVADLQEIIARTAELLKDLYRSVEQQATGADDGQPVSEHLADLERDLADVRGRLMGAASTIALAHTTIGHLVLGGE